MQLDCAQWSIKLLGGVVYVAFEIADLIWVECKSTFYIAGLCKGSITDFDSVRLGSNPSPATKFYINTSK